MTTSLETADNPEELERIVIEPLTRVEGHGKVTLLQDENKQIKQARLHIVEFRGFEKFIQGRPYWELPVVVQRLCGICPVSHHLAAAFRCGVCFCQIAERDAADSTAAGGEWGGQCPSGRSGNSPLDGQVHPPQRTRDAGPLLQRDPG